MIAEELWRTSDQRLGDDSVHLARVSVAPGTTTPPMHFNGDWSALLESGALTITPVAGSPSVGDESDAFGHGVASQTIRAGRTLPIPDGTVLMWANTLDEPVSMPATTLIDDEALSLLLDSERVESSASAMPGKVQKRLVIAEPTSIGGPYRHRVVIRDRSGQLVGARLPRPAELRFAQDSMNLRGPFELTLGPVAFIDGNVNEVLVTWGTGVCGTQSTLDIGEVGPSGGRDPSAIKVTERPRACTDAAGEDVIVALRFKGPWTTVENIQADFERRQ